MLRPIAIPALFLSSYCVAQPPTKPVFEAVSIRPGSGRPVEVKGMLIVGMMQGGPGTPDPERLTGNSVSLRDLVLSAYGVSRQQLAGPGWIETTGYNINAKIPPGTTKDQFRLMLQAMLEDRFKLKLHHETRSIPAYNLVVAKGGLKLRDSVSLDACSAGARPIGGTCRESAIYQSGIMKSAGTEQTMLSMSPPGPSRIISGRAQHHRNRVPGVLWPSPVPGRRPAISRRVWPQSGGSARPASRKCRPARGRSDRPTTVRS